MKWLIDLEDSNVSFNIKILQKNDYIIANEEIKNHKNIYILDGFIQKLQFFTNSEIICVQLLYNNEFFTNISDYKKKKENLINYHYQFKALTTTTLIIIKEKEFIKKKQNCNHFYDIFQRKYLNGDKEIIQIISHKNTKKRLIQLLLILIEHFGILRNYDIYIPINISHYNIATIIGSQRITVNKIMNLLKKKQLIYYDDKQLVILNIIQLIEF